MPFGVKPGHVLSWWLDLVKLTVGMHLKTPDWLVVTTDAILLGWGAFCHSQVASGVESMAIQLPGDANSTMGLGGLFFNPLGCKQAVSVLSNNVYINRL